MANTPHQNLTYAELDLYSIQLAVVYDRSVVALNAFALDAKTEIANFIAEHKITGAIRASVLPAKNFLYLSDELVSSGIRQPSALQGYAGKLAHGFSSIPVSVVCDTCTGLAPDPGSISRWFLTAAEGVAFNSAKETLRGLGLPTDDITLALPINLGAIIKSIEPEQTVMVIIPGAEDASVVWVSHEGVQLIGNSPLGYDKIFEAVQLGLGLKFKAAATKLFFNPNYDFAEASFKVSTLLAERVKALTSESKTTHFHFMGLTPTQAWMTAEIARASGLKAWSPNSDSLAGRLKLDVGNIKFWPNSWGVVQMAAAGHTDAAWVQPSLDTLITRPVTPTKVSLPYASTKTAPFAITGNTSAGLDKTTVNKGGNQPKPVVAKPVAPKPVLVMPKPDFPVQAHAAVTEINAVPLLVPVVSNSETKSKGTKLPIFIVVGVVIVVLVVGLVLVLRKPKNHTASAAAVVPSSQVAADEVTQTVAAVPVASKVVIAAVPLPSALVIPAGATGSKVNLPADSTLRDARKFSNDRYKFEVSEKGFIQALSTPRDEILVESAAGMSLQGSYLTSDGRRKWFSVGGLDDVGYQAAVRKNVVDGLTRFDVKVVHPRFELVQIFTCLPESVQVTAKFSPLNLRDPRGEIVAIHSVRLSPAALNPSLRMKASEDNFSYAMKSGVLQVSFDNTVWGRDGKTGLQNIVASENGLAFHFTDSGDGARNTLSYSITMP
jgi:hypothetical protein